MSYTNFRVNTEHKNRAEAQKTAKEEAKKNILENHQTKMADRNTRKKKQWGIKETMGDLKQPENKS